MTARQVWEGMLTELSKVNAPSMLLQDFNYFFNKAINQYINKRYNIYDINQQTSDDLRVLKATSILEAKAATESEPLKSLVNLGAGKSKLFGATYEVILPSDYLHILNCICVYKVRKNWKCYNEGDYVQFAARRLTADSWSVLVNDYYNRPLPERPYFYIHNININNTVPTNPLTVANPNGTDIATKYGVNEIDFKPIEGVVEHDEGVVTPGGGVVGPAPTPDGGVVDRPIGGVVGPSPTPDGGVVTPGGGVVGPAPPPGGGSVDGPTGGVVGATGKSNFSRTITLGEPDNRTVSTVERDTGTRYGNASNVRMEIRYGHDSSVFLLEKVFIDYIKSPQTIRLTQEQVNLTEDTSQIMEFPDYVCQEIINELTMLVMENTADPRLQTNTTVTQSIANPAHQQTSQPQPQQA